MESAAAHLIETPATPTFELDQLKIADLIERYVCQLKVKAAQKHLIFPKGQRHCNREPSELGETESPDNGSERQISQICSDIRSPERLIFDGFS